MSLIEAIANMAIGYASAVLQLLVFPVLESKSRSAPIWRWGPLFTVASLLRGYVLRRVFEALRKEIAGTLAIRI